RGMVLETGIDIIEIRRIEEAISRHGARFLDRVYTQGEIRQCRGKAESLAARFAAKEAAFKALGERVGWREVEIQRERSGKPRVLLHGRAAEVADRLGLRSWSVSLSHSREDAVAMVVAGK
ncbi:MAG TPA: holo-ACP synthase, partial [Chloroflexota bacterium]|nr:holo-ACP synthase [Chloroflexota bacterium]